jgi:predicted Zn-dependent protease
VQRIWAIVVCCSIPIALDGFVFSQQTSEFESLLASAQQAQARGDFEAAADSYRKAVALRPEIAELQTNLGLMCYQTAKDQQALAAFLRAIRLKPGLFVPNLFLGLEYLKLKKFDEAIPYLKRAALITPTDPQVQSALGQAYTATGNTRLAIAAYLRGTQANSENADGWFHLGVSYLEQVEADARLLLARHKNSGYLHALVADTFAEQRSFIQADEAYKTTLASPAYPDGTRAAYGFVLLNRRDFPGAERELKAELAASPGSPMARLGLARLHVELGQTSTGAKEVADIWKADAAFLSANISVFNRGLALAKISELQHALEESRAAGEIPEEVASLFETEASKGTIADLQEASSRLADTAAGNTASSDRLAARVQQIPLKDLHLLASYAFSTAQYETSFSAAQRLTQNPTTEAEGLYWETRSAQKLATLALARASIIDSNSPTLHVLLGDIYRQRKYYPDAEQEYRKALVIRPGNAGALLGLSLTLLADSEIDEALHLAKAALEKGPDDPELNAVMGEILSAQHDFSGAEPYLKKALKTKPELVPHVHALLGRVYAEANRTQDAINEMKMGLPDDKDGRLHYQLARLYLKVGDQNSAKKAFEASERLRSEGLTRAAVAMQQGENNTASQ